jgi:hypothetical protein
MLNVPISESGTNSSLTHSSQISKLPRVEVGTE